MTFRAASPEIIQSLCARRLLAILGGGQLGRMTAMAARTMGYRVRVMDPEAAVSGELCGGRDDRGPLGRCGGGAPAGNRRRRGDAGDRADRHGCACEVARLRHCARAWSRSGLSRTRPCRRHGSQRTDFPSDRFAWCAGRRNCAMRSTALGGRVFLKIGRGGYDGRGQARIGLDETGDNSARRGKESASGPAVAEQALDLECEISVMAARKPAGEVVSFPAARNHHENQILAWSVLPAGVPARLGAARGGPGRSNHREARHRGPALRRAVRHDSGRTAGERTCAAASQQLSPERARMRDEPVRAAGARGLQLAPRGHQPHHAVRHRESAR